jgi:hypothetical protein
MYHIQRTTPGVSSWLLSDWVTLHWLWITAWLLQPKEKLGIYIICYMWHIWVIESLHWHGCQSCHTKVFMVMVTTDVVPSLPQLPLVTPRFRWSQVFSGYDKHNHGNDRAWLCKWKAKDSWRILWCHIWVTMVNWLTMIMWTSTWTLGWAIIW